MPRQIDADLVHHGGGERVWLAGAHARRIHIDARAGEMLEDRFGHRRAHGVVIAGEEDRARQIARCPPRDQPFQCSAQSKVNRRRAVAISTAILPLSRSSRSRLPSSCSPRRPMSIASILDAGCVLIAW